MTKSDTDQVKSNPLPEMVGGLIWNVKVTGKRFNAITKPVIIVHTYLTIWAKAFYESLFNNHINQLLRNLICAVSSERFVLMPMW
ncbi:hypothetical protein E6P70_08605 [Moraxella nonliquefaciens]|nr:hypothetical protein [Moraxella nonliquefaciens]